MKRKKPKVSPVTLRVLALLSGFIGAISVLILAEIGARLISVKGREMFPTRLPKDLVSNIHKISYDPSVLTHLAIHLPSPRFKSHLNPQVKPLFVRFPGPYEEVDEQVGRRPIPNSKGTRIEFFPGGFMERRSNYTIDSSSRRLTLGRQNNNPSQLLLFMGCSFAFGDGLNDNETIASQAAQLLKNYNVYNYGFSGWGPNNALRLVNQKKFASDLPKNLPVKVVYIFMDHHINRVIGSLDIYREKWDWPRKLPYYYLDSQDRLQTTGMIGSGRLYRNSLYKFLAKSELLTSLDVELPPSFREKDFRLVAAIFERLQATLKDKFPKSEFYVAFFPGQAGKALIPYLDEKGIKSFNYGDMDSSQFVWVPEIPDGHPSGEMNHFFAHQILEDLGLIRADIRSDG